MISFMSCLKVKFSNIVFRLVRNGSRIIYYIFFWKICLLLIPSPKTINAKMMWKFLHKPFKVCCVPDLIIKIILTSYKLPKIAVIYLNTNTMYLLLILKISICKYKLLLNLMF